MFSRSFHNVFLTFIMLHKLALNCYIMSSLIRCLKFTKYIINTVHGLLLVNITAEFLNEVIFVSKNLYIFYFNNCCKSTNDLFLYARLNCLTNVKVICSLVLCKFLVLQNTCKQMNMHLLWNIVKTV